MKKKVKRTFALHHWCGLIAGAFLLVISLSGVILVFHDDIDHAQYAQHKTLKSPASQVSYDASFEQIRRANPGWEVRVPEVSEHADEAILYELRQGKLRKWLFVHPETGEVQSRMDRADQRLVYILLNLHYNLLAGTVGRFLVLFTGIAFGISLITGFILYRKSILKVLTFRQKINFTTRRAFFSSAHRTFGVWALLFNLLMCVTGIYLGFLVVNSALKKKNVSIEAPELTYSIDAAIQNARQTYPDFHITYLRFPANAKAGLQLLGRFESDPLYYGKFYSGIQLDAQGEIAKTLFLRDQPLLARSLRILQPLHFGDYGGWWSKIIYAIGGLTPALLSLSGFFIWWQRRKKRASGKIIRKSERSAKIPLNA